MTLDVKDDSGIQVYLLDPNVYNGYYSPRKALKFHHYQVFDVALAQKEQSPYDPSANCEMYDSLRGYFQCVTDAAEKTFWKWVIYDETSLAGNAEQNLV